MGSAMIAAAGVLWPPSRSAEYHHPSQPARGHRGLLPGQSAVSAGAARGVGDSYSVYRLARDAAVYVRAGTPALRVLAVCVVISLVCLPVAGR